jgi:hypothetical protein
MIAITSASTSPITRAVVRVPISSVASVASSTQPIQSGRPVAMISTLFAGSLGSRSKLPRFLRSHAHFGVCVCLRRTAPCAFTA